MNTTNDLTLPIPPAEPDGPAAGLATLMLAAGTSRYAGILLCPIGEEGGWLVAPGHVPDSVLAEAVGEYAADEGWWPGERTTDDSRPDIDLPARTRRMLAKVLTPCGPDCECDDCLRMGGDADWFIDWAHPEAAVPVTVVDWE